MARAPWADPALYDFASRWVDECLRRDGSLFLPGESVWTAEAAATFAERVALDPGSGDFGEKLRIQVEGLGRVDRIYAAELLTMLLLPDGSTKGDRCRTLISAPLAGLSPAVEIPEAATAVLDLPERVANYGPGKNRRPDHLKLFAAWAVGWKGLSPEEREALLVDPWAFRDFVEGYRTKPGGMQVEAILHLVFPDTFEYVLAPDHKRKLIRTFGATPAVAEARETDEKLLAIRSATTELFGEELNLYGPVAQSVWNGPEPEPWREFVSWAARLYETPGFDEDERDYKLVIAEHLTAARSAVERDAADWPATLKRAFGSPNNLTSWRAHGTFLDWCAANHDEARALLIRLWSDGINGLEAFLEGLPRDAAPGPGARLSIASFLLFGTDPNRLPVFRAQPWEGAKRLLGVADPEHGGAEFDLARQYDPEDLAVRLGVTAKAIRAFLREEFPRDVEETGERWWPLSDEQVEAVVAQFGRKGIPAAILTARYRAFLQVLDELALRLLAHGVLIRDRLDAQSLLWWVSSAEPPAEWTAEDRAAFLAYQEGSPQSRERKAAVDAMLPAVTDDVATSVFLPREWLQEEIVALLAEKRQVILYGPPGTGKTFVAQRMAEHLTRDGGAFEIVQFHPSYSYEDFFEGYRPVQAGHGNGIAYELVPGPLRRMAAAATEDPENPYVLVVDEINRGNLPKIFGELLFLLEYRDVEIALQYSPETSFGLPKNLFIIGTMNTADRSIALVDAALRRRFYFVPFMPREDPISGVLERWLTANGRDLRPARLLAELNARIANDEIAIGPSYLMTSHSDLERIWKHAILPVLEEHYYGTGRDVAGEFGLASLEASLASPEVAPSDDGSGEPEPIPEAAS